MNERYRTVLLKIEVPMVGSYGVHEGRLLLRIYSTSEGDAMARAVRAIPTSLRITDMSIDDLSVDKPADTDNAALAGAGAGGDAGGDEEVNGG